MFEKKRLSDTEFQVMKVVWAKEPPVTTNAVMEEIGEKRGWKLATVLSLMNRLVDKGFLRTEKRGKERSYYQLVDKEEYLERETEEFLENYHENSISSFVSSLFRRKKMNKEEIDELIAVLTEKEEP